VSSLLASCFRAVFIQAFVVATVAMARRWRRPAVFIPRRRAPTRADIDATTAAAQRRRRRRRRTIAVVDGPSGFATQYMDPTTGQILVVSGGAGAPASNVYVVTTRKQMAGGAPEQQQPEPCHQSRRR